MGITYLRSAELPLDAVSRDFVGERFENTGDGVPRRIDIHLNPRFETEWLE